MKQYDGKYQQPDAGGGEWEKNGRHVNPVYNRRYETRKKSNLLIYYQKKYERTYREARISNMSIGGSCFESNQLFYQGEYCFIKTSHPRNTVEKVKDSFDAYCAQVKWCSPKGRDRSYNVGVKQIDTANVVHINELEMSRLPCELCGDFSSHEMVRTEKHLYLCLNCFVSLSQLNGKVLKSNLTRFMVGNVI